MKLRTLAWGFVRRASATRPSAFTTFLLTVIIVVGESVHPSARTWAAWMSDGNWIANAPGGQGAPALGPDGSGGILAAWVQSRPDVFLQPDTNQVHVIRLDAEGSPSAGWPAIGVAVHPIIDGQSTPLVTAISDGDFYVAWNVFPGSVLNPRGARIKRFRPWGATALGWPPEGVELGTNSARVLTLTADKVQSAFAVLTEFKGDKIDHDVAAQRIPADDEQLVSWGSYGARVDSTTRDDVAPNLAPDGSGGAYVAWHVFISGEVLARRLDSTGAYSSSWPAWPLSLGRNGGGIEGIAMSPAGGHGAWVAWSDSDGPLPDSDGNIYLTRLIPDGGVSPEFPPDGLAICQAPGRQISPQVVAVGADAVVVWADLRDSTSFDIYALRVTPTGEPALGWPVGGLAVGQGTGHQTEPALVPDGSGGVLVTWRDARTDLGDIFVQRLDARGLLAPGWPTDGVRLCGAPGRQRLPTIASDGAGGAYIGWRDNRNPDETRFYVTRVTNAGATGPDISVAPSPTRLRFVSAQPNPAAGSQLIEFDLPVDAFVSVEIYDVSGRRQRTIVSQESFDAGTRGVVWDGRAEDGSRLPRGVYLARIRTDGESTAGKLVLID